MHSVRRPRVEETSLIRATAWLRSRLHGFELNQLHGPPAVSADGPTTADEAERPQAPLAAALISLPTVAVPSETMAWRAAQPTSTTRLPAPQRASERAS